jgi:hypothetical protein
MRKFKTDKFIEPHLILAGSNEITLGVFKLAPQVDCRVISEDNYQLLLKHLPKEPALEQKARKKAEDALRNIPMDSNHKLPSNEVLNALTDLILFDPKTL